MSPWLWAFRIAIIAIGGLWSILWLAGLGYVIRHWPRQQEPWQVKLSVVLFAVSKAVVPVLLLLIGVGGHAAQRFAWFVAAPALVASTLWSWFVKWRFPDIRSSE